MNTLFPWGHIRESICMFSTFFMRFSLRPTVREIEQVIRGQPASAYSHKHKQKCGWELLLLLLLELQLRTSQLVPSYTQC